MKARLKFLDGNSTCVPPPPTSVDISGLYILITEVDIDWMPKDLIEDPQACIHFLYRMVEERTLGVKLGTTSGQWYLYGNSVRHDYVTQCLLVSFVLINCPSSNLTYIVYVIIYILCHS